MTHPSAGQVLPVLHLSGKPCSWSSEWTAEAWLQAHERRDGRGIYKDASRQALCTFNLLSPCSVTHVQLLQLASGNPGL